jgi:PadR family transcriptional regulator, regulatory protein PadR
VKPKTGYQELLIGLVRLHVLHHAVISTIFGQGIIEELSSRGYRLGPGTIYPLLRSMERRGWLRAEVTHSVEGRRRICYSATRAGRIALEKARVKLRELHKELSSAQVH